MRPRRLLAGIGVAVLGLYLLLAPIASETVYDASPTVGTSTDVTVSWTASILGEPVEVDLHWGWALPPCTGYCPARPSPPAVILYVYECGTSPCSNGGPRSPVGNTSEFSPYFGAASFSGLPGHHYLVAVEPTCGSCNASGAATPARIVLVTPWLGGAPGVAALVAAGFLLVSGLRLPPFPRGRLAPPARVAESP